jgi:hypothetical protein
VKGNPHIPARISFQLVANTCIANGTASVAAAVVAPVQRATSDLGGASAGDDGAGGVWEVVVHLNTPAASMHAPTAPPNTVAAPEPASTPASAPAAAESLLTLTGQGRLMIMRATDMPYRLPAGFDSLPDAEAEYLASVALPPPPCWCVAVLQAVEHTTGEVLNITILNVTLLQEMEPGVSSKGASQLVAEVSPVAWSIGVVRAGVAVAVVVGALAIKSWRRGRSRIGYTASRCPLTLVN